MHRIGVEFRTRVNMGSFLHFFFYGRSVLDGTSGYIVVDRITDRA